MSLRTKPLDKNLSCRVNRQLKRKFENKARKFGDDVSIVHREILIAFVENRLTIEPDPNKPEKENLYEH